MLWALACLLLGHPWPFYSQNWPGHGHGGWTSAGHLAAAWLPCQINRNSSMVQCKYAVKESAQLTLISQPYFRSVFKCWLISWFRASYEYDDHVLFISSHFCLLSLIRGFKCVAGGLWAAFSVQVAHYLQIGNKYIYWVAWIWMDLY